MRTILNVALGLTLAFVVIVFATGKVEQYVETAVEKAVAEHLGQMEQGATVAEPTAEEVKTAPKAQKAAPAPADNREYIEVRSSKGKAKIYIGQSKSEILEKLGTPDTFDFGGTSERCTYEVGVSWYVLHFRNGKLTSVDKY